MKRVNNDQVVRNFVNNFEAVQSSNGNLYMQGNKLVNYYTVIARHDHESGMFLVSERNYSKTTYVIQNKLKREIPANLLKLVPHEALN